MNKIKWYFVKLWLGWRFWGFVESIPLIGKPIKNWRNARFMRALDEEDRKLGLGRHEKGKEQ